MERGGICHSVHVRALAFALVLGAITAAPAQAIPYQPYTVRLVVKITKKPAAFVHSTSARFAWTHTGTVRSVTCKLDALPARSCSKGTITYRNLTAGQHSFVLRVRGASTLRILTRKWLIDLDNPLAPTSVLGGSASWGTAAHTLTASGGSDATSGLKGYQYRSSNDGGTSWSTPVTQNPVDYNAAGSHVVQFRSVDRAGNVSDWAPAVAGPDTTVLIDRTDPDLPTLTGGSQAWQDVPSVDVTATAGGDGGGSGFDHLSYRVSTDDGATWSAEADGALVTVSDEGATLVRFRAHDVAGNSSAWVEATVRIDRTAPTDVVVSGGSPAWQNVTSLHLAASGSTDSPGSGVASTERQISTDGGATWSATVLASGRTVTAEGETLVQFRTVDASGLASNWVQGTARIDRSNPTKPTLAGGGGGWQNTALVSVTASGSADAGGSGFEYQYETALDGGAWSAPALGAAADITDEGTTTVRFRALDGAGNHSGWVQSTVEIDRTAPGDPALTGGSLSWLPAASVQVTASGSTDAGSGLAGYQYQTSTDGGANWSPPASGATATVTAEGETLVQFQALDNAAIGSSWVQTQVRIDRTLPTPPTVTGGSLTWQGAASVSVTGTGSTDAGGSVLAGYEHRFSTNGGATWSAAAAGAAQVVASEGQTLVQVRALDNAGNASAWTPASATAGSTVRLDWSDPTAPSLAGGSATWKNTVPVSVTASGSTDAASGIARYEYQVSTNAGAWLPVTPTAGPTASVSVAGDSLVRFRSVDGVGRTSAWVQAQVRIDTALPTAPTVTGGSLTWQNLSQLVVSASGSTDAGGSGLAGYQYRTSTNGGSTWSAGVAGSSYAATAEGQTLVQLRSLDGAGNASAWTPASSGASNTVRLDRSAPSLPKVSGGSGATSCFKKRNVSASGSSDGSGSGINHYEHRQSSDNGLTWSAATSGSSFQLSTRGVYLVQFRAVDNVGLASAWAPATATTSSTVCIR